VRELATKTKDACLKDIQKANKVLKKAQMNCVYLTYKPLSTSWKNLSILTYTDSSYKNDEDSTKSVGGRITFLTAGKSRCVPLAWKSKTIQQVCKSVKTAETRSLDSGIEDSLYLAKTVHEIYGGVSGKNAGQIDICLKIDSKTLINSLKSTKQVAWIKQQVDKRKVKSIDWICSEDQLADLFTKSGGKTEAILNILKAGKILF
jgi:hypothetical protein